MLLKLEFYVPMFALACFSHFGIAFQNSLFRHAKVVRSKYSTQNFGGLLDDASDSSFTKQSTTYPDISRQHPLKIHIFVDGTWAYYSLLVGRETACPIRHRFGLDWLQSYRINWSKLPQVICSDVSKQLREQYGSDRFVEVVRTTVFTSMREDTNTDTQRHRMVNDFYNSKFDVHRLVTSGHQEKCVDIGLAVEMLFMATIPDAYDIAVIVTGDKDFMPALVKTRQKGKRVAICSMRNSCNRDLVMPGAAIRDFDIIWLDDFIDEIIAPRPNLFENSDDQALMDIIVKCIQDNNGEAKSRQLGVIMKSSHLGEKNALSVLKERHMSMRNFVERYHQYFSLTFNDDLSDTEFIIALRKEDETDDAVTDAVITDDNKDGSYNAINEDEDVDDIPTTEGETDNNDLEVLTAPTPLSKRFDYTELGELSVKELKDLLRTKDLRISGSKPDLIERFYDNQKIEQDRYDAEFAKYESQQQRIKQQQQRLNERAPRELRPNTRILDNKRSAIRNNITLSVPEAAVFNQVERLMVDFVNSNSPYPVSSREIGRLLSSKRINDVSALVTVKTVYGGLFQFVKSRQHVFDTITPKPGMSSSVGEFLITLTVKEELGY